MSLSKTSNESFGSSIQNMHTKVLYILSKLSMTLTVSFCSSANTLIRRPWCQIFSAKISVYKAGSHKELQEERDWFLAHLPGATCNVSWNNLLWYLPPNTKFTLVKYSDKQIARKNFTEVISLVLTPSVAETQIDSSHQYDPEIQPYF